MRTRAIILPLSALLIFFAAACGGDNDSANTDDSAPASTTLVIPEESIPETTVTTDVPESEPEAAVPTDDCDQDPDPGVVERAFGLPSGSMMTYIVTPEHEIDIFVCSYVNIDYDEVGKVLEIGYRAQRPIPGQGWDVLVDVINAQATTPEERVNPDDNPIATLPNENGTNVTSTGYAHNDGVICTSIYVSYGNPLGLSMETIRSNTAALAGDACGV